MDDFRMNPFSVVIDSREQLPYRFSGLRADARHKNKPLLVQTVTKTLGSGDYSIEGLEHEIAVERKSLADLFGTLGSGRERFSRELERLSKMNHAAVVIEASWHEILNPRSNGVQSELNPKTIFRSVVAWSQEFPTIHWWPMCDRLHAESATFRILERYWKQRELRLINEAAEKLQGNPVETKGA